MCPMSHAWLGRPGGCFPPCPRLCSPRCSLPLARMLPAMAAWLQAEAELGASRAARLHVARPGSARLPAGLDPAAPGGSCLPCLPARPQPPPSHLPRDTMATQCRHRLPMRWVGGWQREGYGQHQIRLAGPSLPARRTRTCGLAQNQSILVGPIFLRFSKQRHFERTRACLSGLWSLAPLAASPQHRHSLSPA